MGSSVSAEAGSEGRARAPRRCCSWKAGPAVYPDEDEDHAWPEDFGAEGCSDAKRGGFVDLARDDAVSTAASSRSACGSAGGSQVATQGSFHRIDAARAWPGKMFSEAPDHPFVVYRTYSFLSWAQRGDAACLSRRMRAFFDTRDARGEFWRWACECLSVEAFLLLPQQPRSSGAIFGSVDHKKVFAELWPLRTRFLDDAGEATSKVAVAESEKFGVSVFCRIRPAPPPTLDGAFCETLLSAPVTLPLGQRVALLRQSRPELSRKEAMMMFLNKKCGAAAPMEEDFDEELMKLAEQRQERPQTGRPDTVLAADATACGAGYNASILNVTPGTSGSVLTVSPGIGIRSWDFAHVFGDASTQQSVYDTCGLRLAGNLANGQSGSLIVYGQTGSGKTHTMFGGPNRGDGLIPKVADEILSLVEARQAKGFKVKLGVSIIEVFGNDVSNLLGKTGAAKLCQRMGTKYVLDGKFEHPVADSNGFVSLLQLGEERKRKAYTEMNERSTRAHTLVILRLRQRAPGQETIVESTLSLVDLGGSERVSKSKANENVRAAGGVNVGDGEVSRVSWQEYYKSRERITETNHINKGLLALKRCVQALNERQKRAQEGRPLVRVPFADSKLTMLLQPAFNGEATTSIVVCCSPEDRHAEETVQSLRFGEMCSSVEHDRVDGSAGDVNAALGSALKQIDDELKEVEQAIRAKEKWEWKRSVRVDVVDEKDTGETLCHKDEKMELGGAGAVEIAADDGRSNKRTIEHEVWSQVLVGAEAENARRDELLKARRKLLGEKD
eukprot:TRINITY_DN18_c0_g2_i1.p1 TRINITY_DN18_c0_g2~~TRINITY_DN18_c0_g2_i1.p1  ORF type:complete len:784 (+),score=224.09 TRINITY_DN18_c0_g2_i1:125-2476(+)